jgi:hypothetical protein
MSVRTRESIFFFTIVSRAVLEPKDSLPQYLSEQFRDKIAFAYNLVRRGFFDTDRHRDDERH